MHMPFFVSREVDSAPSRQSSCLNVRPDPGSWSRLLAWYAYGKDRTVRFIRHRVDIAAMGNGDLLGNK